MSEHQFETHQPVEVYVEIGKGAVEVHATDTVETRVTLDGPDAAETLVELDGDRLRIIAPRQRGGFLGGERRLDVVVTVPDGSGVVTKLGSADLHVTGTIGTCHLRSGSGDVRVQDVAGAGLVETGSGDITLVSVTGSLRVKSGSGDVTIGTAGSDAAVSTGSGDVQIRESNGATAVKTGSGDLHIGQARTDVGLTTGSGDLQIASVSAGRVQVKGASGDVRVGIPAGVPVWTDVSTVTGRIHSTLEGAGQPEDGADYVELRAKTVSGDIVLTQL
ncbi:DUF4097 domain-containing protein [Nocardioides dongxiaopingii]|uniref:DUF4097 family beta strand repeat-containing protein n=1 Tax=Nocardioides TaxID=1839 RepID=UPI0010C76E5A|nr:MULTISPECIES: DUF4097 family beta strand repeat-containing protein [Nocardioides]QCW52097.1 DUF4097 domain-containing protein [Nocardioides sp. S-1144]